MDVPNIELKMKKVELRDCAARDPGFGRQGRRPALSYKRDSGARAASRARSNPSWTDYVLFTKDMQIYLPVEVRLSAKVQPDGTRYPTNGCPSVLA